MTTLVTGSTGFLGQYLMSHLKSLNPNENIYGCALNAPENSDCRTYIIDLTDQLKVFDLIRKLKPQRVFHLAGIAKVSNEITFESYFSQNTLSTQYLLEALVSLDCPVEFFLASSVHVYGNQSYSVNELAETKPESSYGFSKYLAEETLKSFSLQNPKLKTLVGRLYSCVGPKQPLGFVTSDICKKIKDLKKTGAKNLEVGPIDSIRRFTDVRDVVKILPILMNLELTSRFEIFNIAQPKEILVGEMIQTLLDLEGINAQILSRPSADNSFKGLKVDTSKMGRHIPPSFFRPLESTLQDILDSTPC